LLSCPLRCPLGCFPLVALVALAGLGGRNGRAKQPCTSLRLKASLSFASCCTSMTPASFTSATPGIVPRLCGCATLPRTHARTHARARTHCGREGGRESLSLSLSLSACQCETTSVSNEKNACVHVVCIADRFVHVCVHACVHLCVRVRVRASETRANRVYDRGTWQLDRPGASIAPLQHLLHACLLPHRGGKNTQLSKNLRTGSNMPNAPGKRARQTQGPTVGEQGWAHTTNTLYKLGSRLEAFGLEVCTCLDLQRAPAGPHAALPRANTVGLFYPWVSSIVGRFYPGRHWLQQCCSCNLLPSPTLSPTDPVPRAY